MKRGSSVIEVSFAISAGGDNAHLGRLLGSLAKQPWALRFEILIGSENPAEHAHEVLQNAALSVRWFQVRDGLSSLRNRLYSEARGRFVYFIDEDCYLPEGFTENLAALLHENPEIAMAGFYRSPAHWHVFQRAYNSLSNMWLKVHAQARPPLSLAGNVVVPKLMSGRSFPFSTIDHFGGEEIAFAENLQRRGLQVRLFAELSIFHNCSGSPRRFFKRAWLHGCSAYQPVSIGRSLGVVSRHFLQEKSLALPVLVFSYMMTVWLARMWQGFTEAAVESSAPSPITWLRPTDQDGAVRALQNRLD